MMKMSNQILAVLCAAAMLMSMPSMCVLADEIQEKAIITEAEVPEKIVDSLDSLDEDVAEVIEETISLDEAEEVVGEGSTQVGDGVTATFDADTGTVEFSSQNGELWRDWVDKLGVDRNEIISIRVASGTVYLPADSSGVYYYYHNNDEYYDYYLFGGLNNLTSLDLSGFDTSNVTNMYGMFEDCSSLTDLDLSSFDTSNVGTMYCMFYDCSSLTNLNLSSFDTSNVRDMECMFCYCSSLTNLDLSSFDTSNVRDMENMFYDCNSLTDLDLSNFDTSNVEYMEDMLYDCSALQLLKTPKKNEIAVELPTIMYDDAGNEYEELPSSSESIVLTRNKPTTKTDISDCKITLSAISYTYDGKEKKPTVTVKNGDAVLTSGTDYTVNYSDNINAGTATVKVTGTENYKGEKSVMFTINKAEAKLAFAESTLTKKTTDAAFTNTLTKTTDGTVTFKSSNTNVAKVNSTSGLVTIKGAGTAIITATASEGNNYKGASVAYSLTVEAPAPTPTPIVTVFSDVQDPSHPYYTAIYWAAEQGITGGYKDGTFGIDKACTRGHAVMFLWRMAGSPTPTAVSQTPFPDVPKTHPYYKAVLWAQQKGITKGYTSGTNKGKFGIDDTCTRGQIMSFIWRFKGQPAPKIASKSPFSDVPTTHAYYKAILWGSQNGVTKGYTSGPNKGKFGINDNCTRGQIVKFLYNIK